MKYTIIPVTPFQQNCTLLWCTKTNEGVVIDPGGDVANIRSAIQQTGMTPTGIWLTHGHIDHLGGLRFVRRRTEAPVAVHVLDRRVLSRWEERVIVASKGRFDRARSAQQREKEGYPHASTMPVDEFMEATLDVWRIRPESARRVGHPAPFPVELPERFMLALFADGILELTVPKVEKSKRKTIEIE